MRGASNSLTSYVRQLEDAGVEYLWVPEAYGADSVSTLGSLAVITSRANIGSSILPIYSRTPALLAMTAVGNIGAIFGGLFFGSISEKIGRRRATCLRRKPR